MVRCETFRPADGRLDARVFQSGAPVDGSLNVDTENVPVQFVEAEHVISGHLVDEDRIVLVSADAQGVPLQFKVNGRVVIPYVGHSGDPFDPLSHHVGVFCGYQWNRHTHQCTNLWGPCTCLIKIELNLIPSHVDSFTCAINDTFRSDCSFLGLNS